MYVSGAKGACEMLKALADLDKVKMPLIDLSLIVFFAAKGACEMLKALADLDELLKALDRLIF